MKPTGKRRVAGHRQEAPVRGGFRAGSRRVHRLRTVHPGLQQRRDPHDSRAGNAGLLARGPGAGPRRACAPTRAKRPCRGARAASCTSGRSRPKAEKKAGREGRGPAAPSRPGRQVMESIAFGVVAACALLSALAVVRSPNLVRAVLWLGVTLFCHRGRSTPCSGASFVAGVQVLLYVGGVVTLMIFGVMVTRRHGARPASSRSAGVRASRGRRSRHLRPRRLGGPFDRWPRTATAPAAASTADLGRALMREHVMAFEAVSMLLLVAIVGAIVIARRRDRRWLAAKRPAAPRGGHVPAEEAAQ